MKPINGNNFTKTDIIMYLKNPNLFEDFFGQDKTIAIREYLATIDNEKDAEQSSNELENQKYAEKMFYEEFELIDDSILTNLDHLKSNSDVASVEIQPENVAGVDSNFIGKGIKKVFDVFVLVAASLMIVLGGRGIYSKIYLEFGSREDSIQKDLFIYTIFFLIGVFGLIAIIYKKRKFK